MRERRDAYVVLVGQLKERYFFGNSGADGRIILKWLLKNRLEGRGLQSSGSIWGQVTSFCEHGNELSRFIKYGEFDVFLTVHHSIDFFQVTNLMHTSFIL